MDRRTLLPATSIATVVLFLAGAGILWLQQIGGPVHAQPGWSVPRGTEVATSRAPTPMPKVEVLPPARIDTRAFASGPFLTVEFPPAQKEETCEPLVLPLPPLRPVLAGEVPLIIGQHRGQPRRPDPLVLQIDVLIPVMEKQPDGSRVVLPAAKPPTPPTVATPPAPPKQMEEVVLEETAPVRHKRSSLLSHLLALLPGRSAKAPEPAPFAEVLAATSTVSPPVVFPGGEPAKSALVGEEPSESEACPEEESWIIRLNEELLDNLSIFAGIDGAKTPEDLGLGANLGGRFHVNWGVPVLPDQGLGVQVGTAVNYARTATRLLRLTMGTRERTQSFTTLGVFQRSPSGFKWALAHDFLAENYYTGIDARQWRGQVGYDLTSCDEIGLWGTWRARSDQTTVLGQTLFLRPINQINLYWRRIWPNDNVTRVWLGLAEEHGRFIATAPGIPPIRHPICFGAEVHLPLTDQLALFGEAQFITPNDTGTITAYLGLAWYPGGGARLASCNNFAPILPVANNTSLALDVQSQ